MGNHSSASLNSWPKSTDEQKNEFAHWLTDQQKAICRELEKIEQEFAANTGAEPARFKADSWKRVDPHNQATTLVNDDWGGGTMAVMYGEVFEKAGVNTSVVWGEFAPQFRKEIPGTDTDPHFWAAGISLVIHPRSPLIPTIHLNCRHLTTGMSWFGGGTDLTPLLKEQQHLGADFHKRLQAVCDKYDPNYYPQFKRSCDEYFFLAHRNEPRGVGGIFFDYHNSGEWKRDFNFAQDLVAMFIDFYPALVRKLMHESWNDEQRQRQLQKRGRYVEFNLIYDRGTRFGLMTGGNVEAILMSLPPQASW